MDRTAFQNKGVGLVAVIAKLPTDFFRHKIVLLPVGVKSIHGSSPGVELQSMPRTVPSPFTTKVGATSRAQASSDSIRITWIPCPGFPDNISRAFSSIIRLGQHKDSSALGDGHATRLNASLAFFAAVVPASRTLRPDHDAASVGFKFARHAESIRCRYRVKFVHSSVPFLTYLH